MLMGTGVKSINFSYGAETICRINKFTIMYAQLKVERF